MWHRNFGVFLKHACHQAVASDIINALKHKAEKKHETLPQVGKFNSIFVPLTSYLADITCPGSFLLAGRSQENNGEGLTIRRLNHNFKLQMVKSLTCCIVRNNKQQNKTLVAPQLSYYAWKKEIMTEERHSRSSSVASSSSIRVHSIRDNIPPCCYWKKKHSLS